MKGWPILLLVSFFTLFVCGDCYKKSGNDPVPPPPPAPTNDVEMWVTKGDQSALLQKQTDILSFGTTANSFPNIDIDSATAYQSVDGFGYTLTGSRPDKPIPHWLILVWLMILST